MMIWRCSGRRAKYVVCFFLYTGSMRSNLLRLRSRSERTSLATTTACTLLFIMLSGVNHLSPAKDASIHKKRFYGAASLAVSGGVVIYKWGAF